MTYFRDSDSNSNEIYRIAYQCRTLRAYWAYFHCKIAGPCLRVNLQYEESINHLKSKTMLNGQTTLRGHDFLLHQRHLYNVNDVTNLILQRSRQIIWESRSLFPSLALLFSCEKA